MNYNEFVEKINQIKKMGFVESKRSGDTGIGKTLEDMLGITENNIAGPDFDIYELKSGRKDSASMLTLFTKAPMPKGANKSLLETFGYEQRTKKNRKELHVTVDSKSVNSVGLKLEIKEDRVYISNAKNVIAYYDEISLKEAFEKKYKTLILVLASSKKESGKEWFWFNEAY